MFKNFTTFSLSLCSFCVILGIVKLIMPKSFKALVNPALEIMLLIIIVSKLKSNVTDISFDEYMEASYNFSLPYKDLQEQYMEAELAETVRDNLKNRGIIPSDIRIDISIENDEVI